MENVPKNRLTTLEIARRLSTDTGSTVRILRAAGIKPTRCGSAYLWDAVHVENFLRAIESANEAAAADTRPTIGGGA